MQALLLADRLRSSPVRFTALRAFFRQQSVLSCYGGQVR
nr:MAG TPA: hypothetical protein [Caudoviricetes sp.]